MALRLSNGGSTITFLPDAKCCVPSCGAVRDHDNLTVPYYTFPSDTILCREWLNEIRLDENEIGDLSSLCTTHVVCSKHFQHYKGGMKLCVNNGTTSGRQINKKSVLVVPEKIQDSVPQIQKLPKVLKVSTGTQTVENEWIKILKEELDLDILYGSHIQCRVCASISVQAVNIYGKCNQEFYFQNLINSLMPIEVKPTDTKSLNICVHCIFKLKEYLLLFNHCLKIDRDFHPSNECIKSKNKKKNSSALKKNQSCEVIYDFELENDINNTDAFISNDNRKETTIEEPINKSKLNKDKLISKPFDFIKQETRQHAIKLVLSKEVNINTKISRKNLEKKQSSNTEVVYIKFMAEYIICDGKEWINEIHVNKDELKYSKETVDKILKIIFDKMKNQNKNNYSQIVPLHFNRIKVIPSQQAQTTPVIIDGNNHLNGKIYEQTNESFKKIWECNCCGLKLDNKEYYTTHIKMCQPKPCHFCGQHVTPYSKLIEHEKEHRQRIDGFICHLCGRKFTTNKRLNDHCEKHQNYERFCCKTCNLQFNNGFGLRKHLRQQHKDLLVKEKPEEIQKRKQKCSKCLLLLSSKLALRVHMRTHLPIEERKKICPTCNKVFVNAHRFKLHVETHGPCPIKCPKCPRSFPSQAHLDYHLRCHTITEPVYCDVCHCNFKSKATLKKHINRIHQGIQYVQKKFVCVFCKNVFTSKDELLVHRNMHTLEEKAQAFSGDEYGKMKCNECNKCFLFKSRLSLHKKYYHSSLCKHCGKHTTGNSMNHYCKTKGSNALQFCCQCCTKRFSSRQRLSHHERTHGLNYRFQCTVCSKWFAKLSTLKLHSHSHLDIARNTCDICGKIFRSISNLDNHIMITHHQSKDLTNDLYDLNNQNSDQILSSVPLPVTVTENNHSKPITDDVSDIMERILTRTELDFTVTTVQDINLSGTHDNTMPIELDFLTPMTSSIMTPMTSSIMTPDNNQDFLNYDIPHDIDISHDMNITDHHFGSIDILDLQNLYDE